MAQNITLLGASYNAVPAVTLPKTGGGTATFTDVTDTTAAAADVASGKYFYTSAGVKTQGTASGGGSGATVKTTTAKTSSNATSIQFTNLSAKPKMFSVVLDQQSTLGSTRYVIAVHSDGTNTYGTWGYSSSNTRYAYYSDSYFTWTYNNGTLTITTNSSTNGGYFRSGYNYRLIYAY